METGAVDTERPKTVSQTGAVDTERIKVIRVGLDVAGFGGCCMAVEGLSKKEKLQRETCMCIRHKSSMQANFR